MHGICYLGFILCVCVCFFLYWQSLQRRQKRCEASIVEPWIRGPFGHHSYGFSTGLFKKGGGEGNWDSSWRLLKVYDLDVFCMIQILVTLFQCFGCVFVPSWDEKRIIGCFFLTCLSKAEGIQAVDFLFSTTEEHFWTLGIDNTTII